MAKIRYQDINFRAGTLDIIRRADTLAGDYARQGYDLTLRQLFYAFVSRGWLPNTQRSYKQLGSIVNDGRLAGLIDWSHITDRTRNLASQPHWGSPADIVEAAAQSHRLDKWVGQPYYVEVWVEKEALAGVVGRAAEAEDVSYFSCRGYTSQSEMHAAAMRLKNRSLLRGQLPVVIHLGDHDPSGIDMTRDIRSRLCMFMGTQGPRLRVKRIALNYGQIERYNPPPNPAKITDSRARSYIGVYGRESWELDALEPRMLDNLIRRTIRSFRNDELYNEIAGREAQERAYLKMVSDNWDEIAEHIDVEYETPEAVAPPDNFVVDEEEAEYDDDNEESSFAGSSSEEEDEEEDDE